MNELLMPEPERPRKANFATFIRRLMSPSPSDVADCDNALHLWCLLGAEGMASRYAEERDGGRGVCG